MKRPTVDRDYEKRVQELKDEIEYEIRKVNIHLLKLTELTQKNLFGTLLTKQEVADFLRCTVQSVPDDLPCYKMNHKTILYNSEEVRLYVKKHQIN